MSRYDLTDFERRVIELPLPKKPAVCLASMIAVCRTASSGYWDLEHYGRRTTCYDRLAMGAGGRCGSMMVAIAKCYDTPAENFLALVQLASMRL